MTKLPKFLALAVLLAGCGDYARTGNSPADVFYFPTGIAVGHVPTGCQGGTAGCRTRLYVASSNFDLRYDLKTGGALTAVDPDTSLRVGDPVRMGSFAGDVALVDSSTCGGWSGDPLVLVTSRSGGALYGMTVGADGSPSCGAGCEQKLDPRLADPFSLTVGCRGPAEFTAWVGFLGSFQGIGYVQPVALPTLQSRAIQTALGPPAQAMAYDPNSGRVYTATVYAGPTARLYYADIGNASAGGSVLLPVAGEAKGIAISADGTRAYVALRLFNARGATTSGRPGDVGGALAVIDLTEEASGGPRGSLLRLVPLGLGPSHVRAVDRRGMGLRDLVAVTCTDDASFHLYDDEVGSVMRVIGADPAGAPLLGRRPFGLAVESPFTTSTSTTAVRFFVSSFDDGTVSTVLVDDPTRPGNATLLSTVITPGNP